MIFTIVCEELGVFGAAVLTMLFVFLLYRLFFIAQNAPDLLGALIVTGIFAQARSAGDPEYCRCAQCDSGHGNYPSVYQLWRYVHCVPDGGDGIALSVADKIRLKDEYTL